MRGSLPVFVLLAVLASTAAAGPTLVPGTVGLTKKEVSLRNSCTKTFTQVKKARRGDEPAFVAAMTYPRITGLDMDPKKEARAKASLEKFNKWLTKLLETSETAIKVQRAVFDDPAATPTAKVEAAARMSLLYDQTANIIDAAEVPKNVRAYEEAVHAFCDTLFEKTDAIRQQAKDARAACAKAAADSKLGDAWFVPVCAADGAPAAPSTQPTR